MISSDIFVERLSHAMKKLGFSQRQMADAVGVSQGTVSGWLNGAKPQGLSAKALADFLAVRVDWLLGEESALEQDASEDARALHPLVPPDHSAFVMLDNLANQYRRQADEIDAYLRQKKFKP